MANENNWANAAANVKLDGGESGTRRVYEQHEVDALVAAARQPACANFEEWYEQYPDERDYDTGMREAFEAGAAAAHAKAVHAAAEMEYRHPYVKDSDGRSVIQRLCPMDRNYILSLTEPDSERLYRLAIAEEVLATGQWWYENIDAPIRELDERLASASAEVEKLKGVTS